MGYCKVYLCR